MKKTKRKSVINRMWQKARDNENIELVLEAIKVHKALPRSKRNKKYLPDGMNSKDRRGRKQGCKNQVRGEREIENYFLGKKRLSFWWKKTMAISIVGNAVPVGAINAERRQIDLLGLDQSNSPVAIEVKVTDRDPWYAAVELCEYVCRLRHDRSGLEDQIKRLAKGRRYRGAWGILLAPLKWYFKDAERFKKHLKLIEALQKQTKVRICSLAWLGPPGSRPLIHIAGRPPIKRYQPV